MPLCLDVHLMFPVLKRGTVSEICYFAATLYVFLYARPQYYDFLEKSHIPNKKAVAKRKSEEK